MNVLVTGSSGQVGRALLRHHTPQRTWAAVGTARRAPSPDGLVRHFDWTDPRSFEPALDGIDAVFLLRPPALSDVDGIFRPFVSALERCGVERVVFLSVQGASPDASSVIPHAQIEALLAERGLRTVILRPSYFMQNLSTTLAEDIRTHDRIVLPAGRAPFLWVDVDDIGAAAAAVLDRFDELEGSAQILTGTDLLDFASVARRMSEVLDRRIRYRSTGPVRFYLRSRSRGMGHGQSLVMTALHTVPRFTDPPTIHGDLADLIGRPPTTLDAFLQRERDTWLNH